MEGLEAIETSGCHSLRFEANKRCTLLTIKVLSAKLDDFQLNQFPQVVAKLSQFRHMAVTTRP